MNPDGNDIAPLTGNHHTLAWQPSWSRMEIKSYSHPLTTFISKFPDEFRWIGEIMITVDTEEKIIRLTPDGTLIFFSSKPVFHPAPVLIFLVN